MSRVALTDLDSVALALAVRWVEQGLQRVFVPGDQVLEVLSALVEDSRAYASEVFSSPEAYLRRLNSQQLELSSWGIRLITGLAGTGKTALAQALQRLLPGTQVSLPGHGTHLILPTRLVRLDDKWSSTEIRRQLGITQPGVKDNARFLYGSGCSSIGLDETQFMAMSRDAHVRAAKLMMHLCELGPPVHAVMNFSLGHNLQKGNHEIRARLLMGKISVLVPDGPESADWSEYIAECAIVLRDCLSFDLASYRVELWKLSAGVKRNVKQLLVRAYERARANKRKIAWADIEHAYMSMSYSDARSDVLALLADSLVSAKKKLRKDLRCPFESAAIDRYEEDLRTSMKARIARDHERDQLTKSQKAALKSHQPMTSKPRVRCKADRSVAGLTNALEAFQKPLVHKE